VNRITRPIQLPDHNEPSSLRNLTQQQATSKLLFALLESLGVRQRKPGHSASRNDMKSISLWFGVVAIGNLIVFSALGVLIPWALNGGLEIPVVQSRTWAQCYHGDEGSGEKEAYLAADKYQKCWFNTSGILDSCGRQSGVIFDRPVMHVSRNASCPFADTSCYDGVQALQVEYVNVTLRDYGVNLDSRILHSHHLTCAPLRLTRFIMNDSDGRAWLRFVNKNASTWEDGSTSILRQQLSFPNGRARHPTDAYSSFWRDGEPPDLRYWGVGGRYSQYHEYVEQHPPLHPDLGRLDGDTFFVVFNAGRSRYKEPIDDPIYSARFRNIGLEYWPDFEYTALACLEQHRICITGSPSTCTRYASLMEANPRNFDRQPPRPFVDEVSAKELQAFQEVFYAATAFHYLSARGISALLSSQSQTWNTFTVPIDPLQQWTWDVMAWFESSFLLFRVYLQSMITGERRGAFITDEELREMLCGHVLFLDNNYTNINFLGLMMTLTAITIISAFSYAKQLTTAVRYIKEFSRQIFRAYRSKLQEFCVIRRLFPSAFLIMSQRHLQNRRRSDSEQASTPDVNLDPDLTVPSDLEGFLGVAPTGTQPSPLTSLQILNP
jgi:hypothetical protein